MRSTCLFVIIAALSVPLCLIAQAPKLDAQAKAIAPFIDNSTFIIARFDLTKPDCDELAFILPTIERLMGINSALHADQFKTLFASLRKAGAKEFYEVFGFFGTVPIQVTPLPAGISEKAILDLFAPKNAFGDWRAEKNGDVIMMGGDESLQRYRKSSPTSRLDFTKAFAAASESTCQIAIALSPDVRRAFQELIPTLSKELGSGPSSLVTRDLQWAAISLNGGTKKSLNLVAQASDEAAAGNLQMWIPTFLKSLRAAGKNGPLDQNAKDSWEAFEAAILLPPTKTGNTLTLSFDAGRTAKFVKPFELHSQFLADRKVVAKNLRKIANAMHYYHSAKKTFPAHASYDKQGKPLLSWRVHLLPYLGQEELYKEFKLDEPWDSEHNKKLITKMPPIYRHPLGKGLAEGKTAYLVPLGKETIFYGDKGIALQEISKADGLVNTVLLLEVADDSMVFWTKPEDWQFDSKDPHRGLVDMSRPTFMAAFGDAPVHQIKNEIPAEILKSAITRNAGDSYHLGDWEIGW